MADKMNSNDRFEILGELYYRRFHRLRPGKDEAMECGRDSCDAENIEQFGGWYGDGCVALEDALAEIHRLKDRIAQMEIMDDGI